MAQIRIEHSRQGYRAVVELPAGAFVTHWYETDIEARAIAERFLRLWIGDGGSWKASKSGP